MRPVIHPIGLLLAGLSGAMAFVALWDYMGERREWEAFAESAFLTGFCAGAAVFGTQGFVKRLTRQQTFLVTGLSWLTLTVFAALPLMLCSLDLSFTDAFFESMSGVTTTGSTVIVGLDHVSKAVLLWRALLQWIGGIGFVVVALAVLPELRVGGMDLFRSEFSEKSQKLLPRAAQIASMLTAVYLAVTASCAILYWMAGMTAFDAVAHSMTTVATGGYSTRDASLGHYENPTIEWIAVVFMAIGGVPFMLLLQMARGEPGALWRNSQVRWYVSILAFAAVTMAGWNWLRVEIPLGEAFRFATFNVVSIMTGTGYASTDYWLWGTFPGVAFFFLTFIGGCAGSTSCGMKVFRVQLLYLTARIQVLRLIRPHAVIVARYNGAPVPAHVLESVMGFFFLFVLTFAVLAALLSALGLDFVTAVSGAATAIANVGPGLGPHIGPAGSFAPLPDAAKWLMAAGMLLGRLELLTVLVLFVPSFWRR